MTRRFQKILRNMKDFEKVEALAGLLQMIYVTSVSILVTSLEIVL